MQPRLSKHPRRTLLIGVALTALLFCVSGLMDAREQRADAAAKRQHFEELKRSHWPPKVLHFDASDDVTAKILIGNVPLNFQLLTLHPESSYSDTIRLLINEVTARGDAFAINFKATLGHKEPLEPLLGAACVTEQNEDLFYPYLKEVAQHTTEPSREDILTIATSISGLNHTAFIECFSDSARRELLTPNIEEFVLGESISNAISSSLADGRPYDVLPYCDTGEVEWGSFSRIPDCIFPLLDAVEEFGSLFDYSIHRTRNLNLSLTTSATANEALDRKGVIVIREALMTGEHDDFTVEVIDEDLVLHNLYHFSNPWGTRITAWNSSGTMWLMPSDHPESFSTINFANSEVTTRSIPDSLEFEPGEAIAAHVTSGETLYITPCHADGSRGGEERTSCRLVSYDLKTGTATSASFSLDLRLYEIMGITGVDLAKQRLTLVTMGGDAAAVWGGDHVVDLGTGESSRISYTADFSCLEQDAPSDYCAEERIRETEDYVRWKKRIQEQGVTHSLDAECAALISQTQQRITNEIQAFEDALDMLLHLGNEASPEILELAHQAERMLPWLKQPKTIVGCNIP